MLWASLSLSVSLMRLIAPERCVMSAQAFQLALLMWQFEGCDYVSQVTDGCMGGLYSVCLSRVINENPAKHACLHSCVMFAVFCVEMYTPTY